MEADFDSILMSSATTDRSSQIVSRLDRIPIWSLSYIFVGILGLGFLFTFYDIFNINVSFIQNCVDLNFNNACPNPGAATNLLGLPVLINLIGYVVGTMILSPISDRIGRRDMLLVTMLIAGIGSLFTVFVTNYGEFIAARFVTGIGVGADLAIVNTYINEAAPKNGRAKYTSLVFFFSSLGAFFGIWLGLYLTTPSAPFPFVSTSPVGVYGLPFAVGATAYFAAHGWQWMYGIGAILGVIGILLRVKLPESPRWLISAGRVNEADQVVTNMEKRASKKLKQLPPVQAIPVVIKEKGIPYKEVFTNQVYRNRTFLLVTVWFIGYMAIYSIAIGITSILVSPGGYAPPTAGLIAAIGVFGFIACTLVAAAVGEKLENKHWLPISAVITIVGGLIIWAAGMNLALSIVGSLVIFFGFNFWVPMTYSWSTEIYPARARATGFALVDGVGHIGGGVGTIVVVALTGPFGLFAFAIAGMFQLVSALIGQFGVKTRAKRLDEISP
jgi:MFS transporter, putative metabolite:H+ symporter